MVIFQLPHRRIEIESDILSLCKPLQVELLIELGPADYFGDVPASGRLREVPGSSQWQFDVSLFQGVRRPKPVNGPTAAKFAYKGLFGNVPIVFDGGFATLKFNVDELSTLGQFVQEITERLPSAFAPAALAPITILSMTGKVNGRPFTVRYDVTARLTVPGIQLLEMHLDQALPRARTIPRQIVSAQRYLAQNYLLEYSGEFSYQFTGERILNLCKSFESLVPSNVIDGKIEKLDDRIRVFLESWRVHPKYRDVFVSLRKLRSYLDVAHIKRTAISAEAHDSIDEFIVLAERCMQAILRTAMEQSAKNSALYPPESGVVDDIAAIRFIRRYRGLAPPNGGDLENVPTGEGGG